MVYCIRTESRDGTGIKHGKTSRPGKFEAKEIPAPLRHGEIL